MELLHSLVDGFKMKIGVSKGWSYFQALLLNKATRHSMSIWYD